MFSRRLLVASSSLLLLALLPNCSSSAAEEEENGPSLFDNAAITETEQCSESDCVKRSGPEELTYDELVSLSSIDGHREGNTYVLSGDGSNAGLSAKVNALLTTPFVSNEAYFAGAKKHMPIDPDLGPTIRAVTWNIERGEELGLIIDTLKAADNPSLRASYKEKLKDSVRGDAKEMKEVETELDALAKTDVFILNELDHGMRRSGYENVVERLAKELNLNYAYGVEFIEVDPIALGTESFEANDFATYDSKEKKNVDNESADDLAAMAKEANDAVRVDKSKVKALHGNAILSRYPLKNVRLEPLTTKMGRKGGAGCWDWNADEKRDLNFADALLSAGQRFATEKIFLSKSMREIRHGGRTVLTADLVVNGLDGKTLTVVDAHTEAKGTPKCRQDQMAEILSKLKTNKNPVIMGGDLNTSGTDGRPMTVARLLFSRFENPEFYLKEITKRLAIPYAGWGWMAWDTFKWFKKLDDPTSLFNPEHALFKQAKAAGFDFRGEKLRTVKTDAHPEGTSKTLANSNQRDKKGFKTTFSVDRTFGPLGKLKLDWVLVRPGFGKDSYRMAPHYSRTLETLNQAPSTRLSDHYPLTVVLPLKDPCLGKPEGTCKIDMSDVATQDDFSISPE